MPTCFGQPGTLERHTRRLGRTGDREQELQRQRRTGARSIFALPHTGGVPRLSPKPERRLLTGLCQYLYSEQDYNRTSLLLISSFSPLFVFFAFPYLAGADADIEPEEERLLKGLSGRTVVVQPGRSGGTLDEAGTRRSVTAADGSGEPGEKRD